MSVFFLVKWIWGEMHDTLIQGIYLILVKRGLIMGKWDMKV